MLFIGKFSFHSCNFFSSFRACCVLAVFASARVNSQSNLELHKHTRKINDRKKVSNFAQAYFIESLFK